MATTAHADRAALRFATHQVWRGAVVAALAIAACIASVAANYSAAASAGSSLTTLADNPAVRALYGQPFDLGNAGGFTVWRTGVFLSIIGALWAVMTTTRVLRGEEEAGRSDLLLTGPIARGRLVVAHLVALTGASVLIGLATTLTFLATGEPANGSLLYGAGTGLVTLTFAGVGALSAQLFSQRRRAAGIAGLALGVAYLVRMVADGSKNADWLRWASPLGWVEELQAFAGNDLLPLVPLVLAPVVLTGIALVLAGVRDLGEGILRDHDTATPRTRLLRSPLGFAWRERRGGMVGWGVGLAVLGLATGGVTGAFTDVISSSPEFQQQATEYGFAELASVAGFVATMATFTAIVLCLYVVSAVHVLGEDEADGRLDLVFSTRVRRLDWLGAQTLTVARAVVLIAVANALATWAGVKLGNADLSVADALIANLNVLALAALTLGVAVLVHGIRPGLTVPLTGGAVLVAYLLDFLGPVIDLPDWVLALSPFHHVSLAPVEPIAWTATIVMLAVAVVTGVAGAFAYSRRDLG